MTKGDRATLTAGQGLVWNRTTLLGLIAVVGLYLTLRVRDLTAYGIFGDEIWSVWAAASDWQSLLKDVCEDAVHPPLFYMLLKLWVAIGGNSDLWLKLFPVLASAITLLPLYLLCRELRINARAINLTISLMAFNDYLVNYSQDLRMYSLLMMLAVTSIWLFVKYINASSASFKSQIPLLVTNLCLVYTHYYGWLVVFVELIFISMLWRRRALSFALGVALLALLFSPWAFCAAGAAMNRGGLGPNLGWNPKPTFNDLIWYYVILNGPMSYKWKFFGTLLVTLLFLSPPILWMAKLAKTRDVEWQSERSVLLLLLLLSFLPTIISLAASHLLAQSVWGIRFLVITAPFYLLMLSTAVFKLKRLRLKYVIAFLMMAWAGACGIAQLTNRDKIAWEPLVRTLIQRETSHEGAIRIYTDKENGGSTIQYYLDKAGESRFRIIYVKDFSDLTEDSFWVAYLRYKNEDRVLPQDILLNKGYEITRSFEAESSGQKVFFFAASRR